MTTMFADSSTAVLDSPEERTSTNPLLRKSSAGLSSRSYNLKIFLVAPFNYDTEPMHRENVPFYDSIGREIKAQTGRNILLPHRTYQRLSPEETSLRVTVDLTNADLALAHLVESTDVGIMLQRGSGVMLPFITFQERGTQVDPRAIGCLQFHGNLFRQVDYSSRHDAIDQLVSAVRDFYNSTA